MIPSSLFHYSAYYYSLYLYCHLLNQLIFNSFSFLLFRYPPLLGRFKFLFFLLLILLIFAIIILIVYHLLEVHFFILHLVFTINALFLHKIHHVYQYMLKSFFQKNLHEVIALINHLSLLIVKKYPQIHYSFYLDSIIRLYFLQISIQNHLSLYLICFLTSPFGCYKIFLILKKMLCVFWCAFHYLNFT